MDRENTVSRALEAVIRYRTAVVAQLEKETSQLDESDILESPLHGVSPAILEKYRTILWSIQVAHAALREDLRRSFAAKEPQGCRSEPAPLDDGAFLCFNCGAKITKEVNGCPACGWTWMRSV